VLTLLLFCNAFDFSYVELFTVAGTVMATAPTLVFEEDEQQDRRTRLKKMD
jgi:hypothetical protein